MNWDDELNKTLKEIENLERTVLNSARLAATELGHVQAVGNQTWPAEFDSRLRQYKASLGVAQRRIDEARAALEELLRRRGLE